MKIYVFKRNAICFSLLVLLILCMFMINSFSYETQIVSGDSSNYLQDKLNSIFKSSEKIAYLTFDDGPTTKATNKILDILREEDVKATFFVVGKHVKSHPEIVKQAYEDGHFIANHGYSHNNSKLYKSNDSFLQEIRNTDLEIGKAIGTENYSSNIFRFPNGSKSGTYRKQKLECRKLLSEQGYSYIDWNCLNKDSEVKCTHSKLLKNLKESSKNKGSLVVLMHDTSDVNDTPSVLKDSIYYLRSKGYIFKTLDF